MKQHADWTAGQQKGTIKKIQEHRRQETTERILVTAMFMSAT